MPVLTVDIAKLEALKKVYDDAMEFIEIGLPNVDLSSRKDVLNFFEKTFRIELKSVRIAELSEYIYKYGENSEERDMIQGIVYFLKMKYSLKNYIIPMIERAPEVELAIRFNRVEMHNHQPLPQSPEVLECITGAANGVLLAEIDGKKAIVVNDLRGEDNE